MTAVLYGILSLLLLVQQAAAATDTLEKVSRRFGAGEVLQSLTDTIETGLQNRHSAARTCACANHACSNALDLMECTDRLGSLDVCGNGCETRKAMLKGGLVTTPPDMNPEDISQLIAEESCIYQSVHNAFINIESTIYSWAYFGTAGGLSIYYPGAPSARGLKVGDRDEMIGSCEQYDPRVRPWYVDATTAPKDIILLIDASSSMSRKAGSATELTRWEVAKNVAKTAIDLMHFSDAVRVLTLGENEYNTTSEPILLNAQDFNKERLKERLDEVTPYGNKSTMTGLKTAFLTFRRAQSQQIRTTGCQQVILWITDGHLCNDGGRHCKDEHGLLHEFLEELEEEQETLKPTNVHGKASIFVATVGEDVDTKLARHIACRNNGTWMQIHHDRDIVEQMSSYTSFFAGQMIETKQRIIWSRFYEDFSGLGTMTTGTRTIFALSGSGPRRGKLLGVIGYDIPVSQLQENGLTYSEVVGQLSLNIGQCNVHPVDSCQLQILREEDGECPNVLPDNRCYEDAESGRVYFVLQEEEEHFTFAQAQEACREMNGDLAEIRTKDQQALLSSIAKLDGTWIGLTREKGVDDWIWSSRTNQILEPDDTFWAEGFAMNINGSYCAAIDSRGTRRNIEPRNCEDGLHLLCEFRSARRAAKACDGDIRVVEMHKENQCPSLDYCLKGQGLPFNASDRKLFMDARNLQNSEPVFCPLNLEEPLTNAEAQCCADCLASETTTLTSENPEQSTAVLLSPRRTFLLFGIFLFVFLFVL